MSGWPAIEWDDDGYPVAEEDGFAAWCDLPFDFYQAAQFLMRELPETAANCCASCRVSDGTEHRPDRKVKRIEFSTGGWSGAESVMVLVESRLDTSYFMESWRRGGHYVFEVPFRFLSSPPSTETQESRR